MSIHERIEELRPWRYNYQHGDITIKSDFEKASVPFDTYGRALMQHILQVLLSEKNAQAMRAIDLGCLEGHYADLLCQAGLQEVVGVDLSEPHLERAKFLLQELKQYSNIKLRHGNVSDETLIPSLGKFNIVFFHGLLYHLKDPLRIFDILEKLIPEDEDFYLLLGTQYKGKFSSAVSPFPIAELQIKPIQKLDESGSVLFNTKDGSAFERLSLRLNPMAVYETLKAYGYQHIIAYDTPGGYQYSFHSNLIASKRPITGLIDALNHNHHIEGVRFYEWHGHSVDGYDFYKRLPARIVRGISVRFNRSKSIQKWLKK